MYDLIIVMAQPFSPGDFLVFQLESGFALLRLLAIDEVDGESVWHLAAYDDLFPDIDMAEAATAMPLALTTRSPHLALTKRAFESTQVAKIGNAALSDDEKMPLNEWRADATREVSDRSVRLLLGLR